MVRVTFAVSAALGAAGTALAVAGVQWAEFKPVAIGFFLLLGAGVFAVLSLSARRADPPQEP